MVFSSIIFILVFLPIFLLLYYIIPTRLRNLFIVFSGYLFYSWGAPRFAFVLLITITMDYFLSLLIASKNNSGKHNQGRFILIFSVLVNVGLLGYFKYSNFFVGQLNYLFFLVKIPALPWREVILPIGISFTIFQELSYIIEVYRGKIKPAKSLIDFAAYLMLFPHVIAGPIVRYIDIAGQLESRAYSLEHFFEGIRRFSIGLAKKVLIANPLSGVADAIFYLHQIRDLSSPLAWLGIVCYSMQIYFDFSGYSDMAIGLAKMTGFDFLENFNKPYTALNITDFWRRWHISLSTWMREYLYFSLGGNRISIKRTYLNLWIVFLISGLWHGASWCFVFWGAFHGFFLIIDRLFWLKASARLPKFLNIALTFVVVLIGWAFFRIENIGEATKFVVRMFDLSTWFTPIAVRWSEVIDFRGIIVLIIALVISFFPATELYKKIMVNFSNQNEKIVFACQGVISLLLFFLSIVSLVNAQFNPFIYFRF